MEMVSEFQHLRNKKGAKRGTMGQKRSCEKERQRKWKREEEEEVWMCQNV